MLQRASVSHLPEKQCAQCFRWFNPRSRRIAVCLRCEAKLTLLDLRFMARTEPQLALPFPLRTPPRTRRPRLRLVKPKRRK